MSVNSAPSASLATAAFDEYRRYERYLALAWCIGVVSVASLLCPGSAAVGSLFVAVAVAVAFRKYHKVIHLHVGSPSMETDNAVHLWGTTAQASTWAAVPIILALTLVQISG